MRPISALPIIILVITTLNLFSCKGTTEELTSENISDYLPLQLQPGKYITYRLDSMVFTNFGRDMEVHRYQMKHVVDAQMTDNQGRPCYRIYTYIRDSAGTQAWDACGTYVVTPLAKQTEVTDDNLRVIKVHLPIKEGFQWKGNTYLPDEPYSDLYDFNNDNDMKDWDFVYDGFEPATVYRGNTYTDVYTVTHQDDYLNIPVVDINMYGYKSLSVEKYSKNVGMVYRKYELWEYQPNISGPSPYNTGFGVTLWMIDHN